LEIRLDSFAYAKKFLFWAAILPKKNPGKDFACFRREEREPGN
jgi:hypothetical protein